MSNKSPLANTLIFGFILVAAIFTMVKHEQYSMAILHGVLAIIGLIFEGYEYSQRKKLAFIKNN